MPTLVYVPGVSVHVATHREGVLDLTEDLLRGAVTLSENDLHHANLTFKNHRRKYDAIFTPNDRIAIRMKRLRWMLVMTGYLNAVPYYSVYPTSPTLSASCTLKRLKFWLYDPGSLAYSNLYTFAQANNGWDPKKPDAGTRDLLTTILKKVSFWPQEIHIAGLPQKMMQRLAKLKEGTGDLIDWEGVTLDATLTLNSLFANGQGSGTGGGGGTGSGTDIDLFLAALRDVESGGDYKANNARGGARGAYQYIDPTWRKAADGISNAPRADLASPAEQDAVARRMAQKAFDTYGNWLQVAMTWYYPQWAGDQSKWDQVPAPGAGNRLTLRQHAEKVVAKMNQLKGGASGSGGGGHQSGGGFLGIGNFGRGSKNTLPKPNSQELLGVCRGELNKPYSTANRFGPNQYDCSGYVVAMHRLIGYDLPSMVSDDFIARGRSGYGGRLISEEEAWRTPGALVIQQGQGDAGHIAISRGKGPGKVINATPPQVQYSTWFPKRPYYVLLNGMNYVGDNGEIIQGGGTGGDGIGSQTPRIVNLFQPFVPATDESNLLFGGLRAVMNDHYLLDEDGPVKTLMGASMRSFCAAPNGDFIGWFPDYFDQYGVCAKMVVQDIEIRDFSLVWDDTNLVSHQFVSGASTPGVQGLQALPTGVGFAAMEAHTAGIATVEIPAVMDFVFGWSDQPPSRIKDLLNDSTGFLDRFGARKEWTRMLNSSGPVAEFMLAVRQFMINWSAQFNARIPLTWMPELFPGMIVKLPSFGVQFYANNVTHTFDFEQGTFETDVDVFGISRTEGGFLGLIPQGGRV
jgi:hypothetical protein